MAKQFKVTVSVLEPREEGKYPSYDTKLEVVQEGTPNLSAIFAAAADVLIEVVDKRTPTS